MAEILIVDDDPLIRELLDRQVTRMGHNPHCAATLAEARDFAIGHLLDVIFLDVRMPDGNGLEMLTGLRKGWGSPEVIIITGAGDPDGAELSIKSGAWDYVQKGASIKDLVLPLTRALQYREQKNFQNPPVALKRDGIVGKCRAIGSALDMLAQASANSANVLINGETGTGKEVFARAIHDNSSRADANFVVVDCAALPESLVENVLFGHERGAYTGADSFQEGLVKHADGGTLFLDEVGEMPLSLQKAFLRVLQERRFRPLGSQREVNSDFRLVVATNRNLETMVKTGQFREDLLYRLRALSINLPPLRERGNDLAELVVHQLSRISQRYESERKGFGPDFLNALSLYSWPGNVRELFSALEQAVGASGDGPTLFARHLPERIRIAVARRSFGGPDSVGARGTGSVDGGAEEREEEHGFEAGMSLKEVVQAAADRAEARYLLRLMQATNGDIQRACARAGLSRTGLYSRLKKHGIKRR